MQTNEEMGAKYPAHIIGIRQPQKYSREELGGRQCAVWEHERSRPPTVGSLKREGITIGKSLLSRSKGAADCTIKRALIKGK